MQYDLLNEQVLQEHPEVMFYFILFCVAYRLGSFFAAVFHAGQHEMLQNRSYSNFLNAAIVYIKEERLFLEEVMQDYLKRDCDQGNANMHYGLVKSWLQEFLNDTV